MEENDPAFPGVLPGGLGRDLHFHPAVKYGLGDEEVLGQVAAKGLEAACSLEDLLSDHEAHPDHAVDPEDS